MIENMNLEWIKTFVFFAESAGVDETAKKMGLTQPAVSQHLTKLEAHLPQRLFSKDGKKKILTPFGKEFYKNASLHLRNIDELLRSTKFLNAAQNDVTFRLGLNREILYRICDKIQIAGKLEIKNVPSDKAAEELTKRSLDIAVSRFVPDSADIIAVKWFTDNFVLIYPKSWAADIAKHGLSHLQKKAFVMYGGMEEQTQTFLMSLGIPTTDLKKSFTLTDWFSFIKLVEKGQAWGFAPSSFEFSKNVQTAPLPNKAQSKSQFYLLYHRTVRNYSGFQDLLEKLLLSMS